MLDVAGPAQQLHKVLVVGDDQELEVPLSGAALDDSGRAFRFTECGQVYQRWS